MSPPAARLARSQETLWEFVSCFAPGDPGRLGYNVFDTAAWSGPVDPGVFTAAVADVARRHDALRIVFASTGVDPLIRVEEAIDPPVSFTDLSAESGERRVARRAAILGYERGRAFDLGTGPLWSVTLIRDSPTSHLVAVSLFHLIADGWSTGVFLKDLETAYRARTDQGPPLVPLRLSYAAAMAPPGYDDTEARRRAEYWKRHLTPLPGPWPYAPQPRHPGTDVTAQASLTLPIPADLVHRLHAFARRQHLTPFVLFLAAYRILLGARTGWPRLVLGTATAGRDAPGAEDLVGQFTHNIYVESTIPLATTLADALARVRASSYEAMRHTASFTEIARAVNPDFDQVRPWPFLLLYHSWFQSAAPAADPEPTPGLHEHRSRTRNPGGAVLDDDQLRLWAKRGEPGLVVRHDRKGAAMTYNPTFYPRDAMVATLHGYTAVLQALLADPQQRIGDLGLA